jgi:colanic acid biosynthesis glycosyl transferase WcaI
MNIMMISLSFPPEINSCSHLFHGLGGEFVRRGHRVTVVTGFPSYNIDRANLPPKYRSGLTLTESVDGMKVVRIRTIQLPRNIPVLRGIDQIMTSMSFAFAGMFFSGARPDIVLVYSPPLFLGMSGWTLKVVRKAKVVLNVQDLFPQNAIDLGVLKNKFLIAMFRWVESFLYRNVDAIAVHSSGNRAHVVRQGGAPEQTKVVFNPVDTKTIVPGTRNGAFRRRYRFTEDQLLVSYAGILGYAQDLDTVIEAAALMRQLTNVVFLVVGDGVEKPRLMKKADGMGNVRFLPMLERDEYLELLHASDVCLATLRASMKTPVIPAKILSIMAAGRPLVAAFPLDGDAPALIGEARAGICVEPENALLLADAIRSVLGNPPLAQQYSHNGRAYVEAQCSLEGCASAYESVFEEITRRNDVRV